MNGALIGARPLLFRVQAEDGRGPFRPGFSRHWIDTDRDLEPLPDWISVFGLERILSAIPHGWHAGCACRSLGQLARWFTRSEMQRLSDLGYFVVTLRPDRVLAENGDQVVFARRAPLNRDVMAIHWEAGFL